MKRINFIKCCMLLKLRIMGDISDLHYGIAIQQMHEVNEEIQTILDKKDNDELFLLTNDSDDDLVIEIRKYYQKYKKLSKKQRYCLARWICEQS